jgi:uncharacterized protein DUF6258
MGSQQMKNPVELAKSIYLGDRACKSIKLDGWNKRVSLEVDNISRVRDPSGNWNFYVSEDIKNGRIVFDGVTSCSISPQGLLPNDWIDIVSVEPVSEPTAPLTPKTAYLFTISLGAVDETGAGQELTLKIVASAMYLEDPGRSDCRIAD